MLKQGESREEILWLLSPATQSSSGVWHWQIPTGFQVAKETGRCSVQVSKAQNGAETRSGGWEGKRGTNTLQFFNKTAHFHFPPISSHNTFAFVNYSIDYEALWNIYPLIFTMSPWGQDYDLPHFTDEETSLEDMRFTANHHTAKKQHSWNMRPDLWIQTF